MPSSDYTVRCWETVEAKERGVVVGVIFSLITALCWAISPLCFASAGRRVGALPVALVRILLASLALMAMLPAYLAVTGTPYRAPTAQQFLWIVVSGVAGIVAGDIITYEALVKLGPRRTTQLYPLTPVVSVALAWLAMGEAMTAQTLVGAAVVLTATAYAILSRPGAPSAGPGAEPGTLSAYGVACACTGATLAGVGAVAMRKAYLVAPGLDPFVAITIRVVAATAVGWLIPVIRGNVAETIGILNHKEVTPRILAGTLAGPITGMICYGVALKLSPAGLVSTLVSTSPLFVLPYVTLRYRAKIGWLTPVATATAIAGVSLICWPGLPQVVARYLAMVTRT